MYIVVSSRYRLVRIESVESDWRPAIHFTVLLDVSSFKVVDSLLSFWLVR